MSGDARSIVLRFDIFPATATTCGDGSGQFCRYYHHNLSGVGKCVLFGPLSEKDGWVQRHVSCLAAETDPSLSEVPHAKDVLT